MIKARIMQKNFLGCAATLALLFCCLSIQSLFAEDYDPTATTLSDSLKDDVTAMITNAKQLPHTIFILDTSDNMNTFAYSDYLMTCKDAEANLNNAYALCLNAYDQCRNVERNAMCDVDLGCPDVKIQCNTIYDKKVKLTKSCGTLETTYKMPGINETVDDVETDPDALKYVGPWNPSRDDYTQDICFYNWVEDTNGDVLEGKTSGHITNPSGDGHTDRRDWDCLSDGKGKMTYVFPDGSQKPWSGGGVSGLWLNWKYATSLDALKIILANTHSFSYPPRFRGKTMCMKNEYYPYLDLGNNERICYEWFDTNPSGEYNPEKLSKIRKLIQENWTVKTPPPKPGERGERGVSSDGEEYWGYTNELCDGFSVGRSDDRENRGFVLDVDPDSIDAPDECTKCMKYNESSFEETPCKAYDGDDLGSTPQELGDLSGETKYECCKSYKCVNPKCRDDDVTCLNDGGTCILGYYSVFDQDEFHCCDKLTCEEEGGITSGDPEICSQGTVSITSSISATVPAIILDPPTSPDVYNDVHITITASNIVLNDNVANAIVTIFYDCADESDETQPSTELGHKIYSTDPDSPPYGDGDVVFSGGLSGCDDKGYRIMATLKIEHNEKRFEPATASLQLDYSFDSGKVGQDKPIKILDPSQKYYLDFTKQITGPADEIVQEYECKTAFYARSSLISGKRCPHASEAVYQINASRGSDLPKLEYCDESSKEEDVIAADQWGKPTKKVCSWLCREGLVYDDVWKCLSFFYQMDELDRNGSGECTGSCAGDNVNLKDCCQCVSSAQSRFNYFQLERPQGVQFDNDTDSTYNCVVSGYQFAERSDGGVTHPSAYQAEIIAGHIKEAGEGSYRLQPYVNDEWKVETDDGGVIYTPYSEENGTDWYKPNSLVESGAGFLTDSFVSLFKTSDMGSREVVCAYDLVWGFGGEDCNSCGTGCCAVDIVGDDNGCDYPNFWLKVPNSEGGELLLGANNLVGDKLKIYKKEIRDLKAKGGSALAETLYDVWRYLGGMYSMHDPNYLENRTYESPFVNNPPECFLNQAVIISGGQPKFDSNYTLHERAPNTAGLPAGIPEPYTNDPPPVDEGGNVPYVHRENWYNTALENVGKFVHSVDFWHSEQGCRTKSITENAYGFGAATDCKDTDTSGENVIDTIHSVAIGEWALSPLYATMKSEDSSYLDNSIMKNVAENSHGKYYTLTAEKANDVSSFSDLTSLFKSLITQTQKKDVVSGRPHWTSSLVQPLDVEEKVRGPEAYSAGALPIDGNVSRFWFGNLKKFTIDDASSGCNITGAEEGYCGAWQRQELPEKDCFAPNDSGSDMQLADFKALLAGGAAKKLEESLLASPPDCPDKEIEACYKKVNSRTILYDNEIAGELKNIKDANIGELKDIFKEKSKRSVEENQVIQLLDYMYGFDSYDDDGDGKRNQVRFVNNPTEEVCDPFEIDFKQRCPTLPVRKLLLGAIVHSRPLAVYYDDVSKTRIFVGANDGMLHSFDENGNETFAYIPSNAFASILGFDAKQGGIYFNATVDGPITLLHIDQSHDGIINSGEKAYLIFGYRRGASGYTIIDISTLDKPKFVKNINTGGGLSFGKAVVFRKCSKEGGCFYADDLEYYLAIPGGYDICNDPTSNTSDASDNKPFCNTEDGSLKGNKFSVFKLNKESETFDEVNSYTYDSGNTQLKWLQASLSAAPLAINTKGKLAVDTEFLYFVDLSSTLFRLDVRDPDPNSWELSVVHTLRDNARPSDLYWSEGVREYAAVSLFPPLMKYPSYHDAEVGDFLIPIPNITGNAANLKVKETDKFTVFYDKYDNPPHKIKGVFARVDIDGDEACDSPAGLCKKDGGLKDGWQIKFMDPNDEKGVTDMLIIYDLYGSKKGPAKNNYSISWNTYVPQELTDCTNFGTSRNYQKLLVSGTNDLGDADLGDADPNYWDPSKCNLPHGNISIATAVGVVATSEGYNLTFGAGADIFMKEEIKVKPSSIDIIKWYELY